MMTVGRRIVLILFASWLAWPVSWEAACRGQALEDRSTSQTGTSASRIERLDVGLGGLAKVGQWTTIRVQLNAAATTASHQFFLQLPDSDGVPVLYRHRSIQLPSNGRSVIEFLVRFGQWRPEIELLAQDADGQTVWREKIGSAQLPTLIASSQQVVLNLNVNLSLPAALGTRSGGARDRTLAHVVSDPQQLPTHWLGYGSADAIVLPTGNPSFMQQMRAEHWTALRQWVEMGGYLVVSGGPAQVAQFQQDGPLHWASGGEVVGATAVRQTTGLEQYCGATNRLDRSPTGSGSGFSLPLLDIRQPRGPVEVWDGLASQRQPIVIRSSVGLGRVTWIACDLDLEPLQSWPDRTRLLAQLLSYGLDEPLDENLFGVESGPVAHLGFTDLVGQLRRALDEFTDVRFVPFAWIAGLAVAYMIWIGPVDFWILKRLQRPHWTWITAPVTVLVFTGLAIALADQWKGRDARSNLLSVLDVDASTGIVRGTCWNHVYSPATIQYDIGLRLQPPVPGYQDAQRYITWQGLPGKGFAGLDRNDATRTFADPYRIEVPSAPAPAADAIQAGLRDLPIAIWSSRALAGQWWGQDLQPRSLEATALSSGDESMLQGTLRNPLDRDLRDAVLVYDRWAYPLGTLRSESEIALSELQPIDLQTFLTERRVVEGRSVTAPWNQQSTDVNRIAQMLFFYGAAEGQGYTRLQHRYQRYLDWSDHARLHRAVLWGTSSQPNCSIEANDQEIAPQRSWHFCRILLPVKQPGN